jgi:hypothetical protein
VSDKITYYAIVGGGRTIGNPWGLLRRLEFDGDGYSDEVLRVDFSWSFTPLIIEWEHGDAEDNLVEVSHARATGSPADRAPSAIQCGGSAFSTWSGRASASQRSVPLRP